VNPIWNFIILKKKKKKIKLTGTGRKKKKKKNQPTAGETQPWVSVASREVPGRGRNPSGATHPFCPDPPHRRTKKTRPWWVALAGRGWPVGHLSFSQIISLSLLNDKKKEEGRRKKEEGRRSMERSAGGNGREEEMEGRRRRKKKKLSVLECRIIL
jgi:hypothetical protein